MPTVLLSNGVSFECGLNESILDAAQRESIVLEHSCRNGRCGVCVAPVSNGHTKMLRHEEFLVQENDSSGRILTCCRAASTDIALDIECIGAIKRIAVRTLPCRIEEKRLLNDDVMQLIFRMAPTVNFDFVAGQYINLIHNGFRRSYSLANTKRVDGRIEIHIKRVRGGSMSEYIFGDAKEGDLLRVEGPLGSFSYREDNSKNVVFMATGTGIAPIVAMIESNQKALKEKNVYIVWGGRKPNDLYINVSQRFPEHSYLPVLSRSDLQNYDFGYVQEALLRIGLDFGVTAVYACGSDVMIRESRELLIARGLELKKFHSDAFVSSG